jgi:hypothetical protein
VYVPGVLALGVTKPVEESMLNPDGIALKVPVTPPVIVTLPDAAETQNEPGFP